MDQILDAFVGGLWKRDGRDYVIICLYSYWAQAIVKPLREYLVMCDKSLEGTSLEYPNRMMLFRVRTEPCFRGSRINVRYIGKARTLKEVIRYEKLEGEANGPGPGNPDGGTD